MHWLSSMCATCKADVGHRQVFNRRIIDVMRAGLKLRTGRTAPWSFHAARHIHGQQGSAGVQLGQQPRLSGTCRWSMKAQLNKSGG